MSFYVMWQMEEDIDEDTFGGAGEPEAEQGQIKGETA